MFELKLQIQHLQEKVTFLAGGSNGAELAGALMERDEELERTVSNGNERCCVAFASLPAVPLHCPVSTVWGFRLATSLWCGFSRKLQKRNGPNRSTLCLYSVRQYASVCKSLLCTPVSELQYIFFM